MQKKCILFIEIDIDEADTRVCGEKGVGHRLCYCGAEKGEGVAVPVGQIGAMAVVECVIADLGRLERFARWNAAGKDVVAHLLEGEVVVGGEALYPHAFFVGV